MPNNIDDLLGRNEAAARLVAAGFTIGQAQGPDYDDDGNPIVYEDEEGNPSPQPTLVWWVQILNSAGQVFFGTYVQDDDQDTWDRIGNPSVIDSTVKHMRSDDPDETFELSPEASAQLAYVSAVAVGDMTQEDADASFHDWKVAQSTLPSAMITMEDLSSALDSLPDGPVDKNALVSALQDILTR